MKLQTYRIMLRNRLAQAGIATADLDAHFDPALPKSSRVFFLLTRIYAVKGGTCHY